MYNITGGVAHVGSARNAPETIVRLRHVRDAKKPHRNMTINPC